MEKRLTQRVVRMLNRSLRQFPELRNLEVRVGHTRTKLGVAFIPTRLRLPLYIRLRVRGLTYNTIGHELTHLLQGLTKLPPPAGAPAWEPLPGGETQCDIWTLARSEIFCDDAPTYLRMPRAVRENWRHYAGPGALPVCRGHPPALQAPHLHPLARIADRRVAQAGAHVAGGCTGAVVVAVVAQDLMAEWSKVDSLRWYTD